MADVQLANTSTEAADRDIASSIGHDLRALRKSKGLTLAELGLKTGRSVGYLSQVERGLSNLSITDLKVIAGLLEVPLAWFLVQDETPAEERGYVVRAGARRKIGTVEGGLVEELLSPDLGGTFEMIRSVFEPGAELSKPELRETEEAGYLIFGELELWIGGRYFHLNAGDSFRFHHETHRWRNPGKEPAVVIWVITPPVY